MLPGKQIKNNVILKYLANTFIKMFLHHGDRIVIPAVLCLSHNIFAVCNEQRANTVTEKQSGLKMNSGW